MYHEKDFNNTRLPLHMDKDNKSSISTAFPSSKPLLQAVQTRHRMNVLGIK